MQQIMKKKFATVFMAGIIFWCLCAGMAWSEEKRAPESQGKESAATPSPFVDLKKTYGSINSLEAKFHQKLFIASLKKERELSGSFLYKRRKGFIWNYSKPREKYFLYDGNYIWQGEEGKPFIVKDRVKREKTGGTFLDLVEDIAKLDELFTLKQHGKEGEMTLLELVPKRDSTVTLAKIWIDRENIVKKIEIHEFTGNVNEIEFSSIRVNGPVDEGRLAVRRDQGKEILER